MLYENITGLEQLEHLHSEDTPATSWLPIWMHSEKKTKSKLQI